MKFTTARRLIKEQKRGAGHPEDLIARAHSVCREQHRKIEAGEAAAAEIAAHAKEEQQRLIDAGMKTRLFPEDMTAEEFAARQVKMGRRGQLDRGRDAFERGEALPKDRLDPMGNPKVSPIFPKGPR